MHAWTQDQWIAFCALSAAGVALVALAALAIRAVRGWTAPAHAPAGAFGLYYVADAPERQRQATVWKYAPAAAIEAGYPRPRYTDADAEDFKRRWREAQATRPHALAVLDDSPEVVEHLAPGPGSLTALRDVGPGVLDDLDRDFRESTAQWLADLLDRPAHVPARDEARELDEGGVLTRFHTAIEGAMRKAHLWEIQGRGVAGHDSARMTLDHWRAGTDTGAWPVVVPIGGTLTADIDDAISV